MDGKPQDGTARFQTICKLAVIVGFLVSLNFGGKWALGKIDFQLWPEHEHIVITALWIAIAVYILWMTVPFVPGIELGLALMVTLGSKGVVLVYFCTLLSLSLSYAIGRLIPLNKFAGIMGWLRLRRFQNLVLQMEPLNSEEKLNFLIRAAPSKIVPFLLKHRYLMIAIILNLPGNALIGGGGGIGVVAGMSGLYSFSRYILLITVAITPLPLLLLTGHLPEWQ